MHDAGDREGRAEAHYVVTERLIFDGGKKEWTL